MAGHGIFAKSTQILTGTRLLISRFVNPTVVQTAPITKATKELIANLNIPEKPKKPLTSYIRFVKDHRPEVVEKFPEWTLYQVITKCAEDWKQVHPTVKEKYQEQYLAEHKQYETAHLKYTESLTPKMREALAQKKKEVAKDRKKRLITKLNKEHKRPKAPLTAYNMFIRDYCTREKIMIKDVPKNAWEDLNPGEKQKYAEKAQKERDSYKLDLDKWKHQMTSKGLEHVVEMQEPTLKVKSKSAKAKKTE